MDKPLHPAPAEFTPAQLEADPILKFFHYRHLPDMLREISEPFCDLAFDLVEPFPATPNAAWPCASCWKRRTPPSGHGCREVGKGLRRRH